MGAPPAAPISPDFTPAGKAPAIPGGALGLSHQLAVSGRLLIEDREAPPEPVQVDYVCRGKMVSVVTDAKGKFSIPVATGQVARSGLGTAVPDLTDCRVQVRAPGFEDLVVNLKHATKLSDLDLGDLALRSVGAQSIVIFSAVARKAPAKARSSYINALVAIGLNKYDDAIASLDKALRAFPQYSSAFQLKGEVLEEMGQRDAARECYRQAMAADPGYGKPLVKLAEMAADDQNSEEAARWAGMANRLAPGAFAKMYLIEGSAYFNLGRFEEAGKAAQAGITADRTDSVPGLHRLLGEVFYQQRNYAAAGDQFNRFVADAPEAPDVTDIKARAQSCEKLARTSGK
jgi:TolA-binding protein